MTKRKLNNDPSAGSDSAALHAVTAAIMDATGRGGLTNMATMMGMTVSAAMRRLRTPNRAFDAPTMRAVLYIASHKRECAPAWAELVRTETIGNYVIEFLNVNGSIEAYWRAA